MRPKLRVKYVDCYNAWNDQDNLFTRLLSQRYDVEISDNPDLLFYLPFGTEHLNYRCRKVFVTGENFRPDFAVCDYAFSFDYLDDPRNYRLPLAHWSPIERPADWDVDEEIAKKTGFCNFVYSNRGCVVRNQLFKKLSRYKRVDAGGRCMNNIGHRVDSKLDFQSQFKFSIAYENSSYPGYLTEKLADAFRANTVPIYWGDPHVQRDFNAAAFINYSDYGSNDAVIERIIELDQDDDAYREMLSQPCYPNNEFPKTATDEAVLARLTEIVESEAEPVAAGTPSWSTNLRCRAYYKTFKWRRRFDRWKYKVLPV